MNNKNLENLLESKKRNVRVENLSISIGEINSMYRDKELILRPEYQRLLKWTDKQKTLFIESILLGLPTPSIFVSVDEDGKWEIVDGLQRLSTVLDFISGLEREDTQYIPNYNPFRELTDDLVYLSEDPKKENFIGTQFADLSQKIQLEFKRQRVNVVILLSGTSVDVKYELFQRVNEGGTPITPMEFRRAILSHQNPDVLSKIDEFRDANVFKDFLDDSFEKDNSFKAQAAILYFLTLYRRYKDHGSNIKVRNVDAYITEYVRKLKQDEVFSDLNLFKKSLEKIKSLGIDQPKKIFTGNNKYSDTVFGAITLGIALNIDILPNNQELKNRITDMIDDDEFKDCYKRGLSASARIPKMLFFCERYFSTKNS